MEENEIKYSVVIPVFNEEENIKPCYERLTSVMQKQNEQFELLFVDDGSKDNTLNILKEIASNDKRVKVVVLSRNFGQQSALLCGFEKARGNAVINIDADLQDPPEVILEMIEKFKQGYDIVIGRRRERKGESFFKKFTSNAYQFLLKKITKSNIPTDAGDFRLISKRVCKVLVEMPEHSRYLRGMTEFVGFKQTYVLFDREERKSGKTKYNLKKLVNLGIDGIVSNTNEPLMFNFKMAFAGIGLSSVLSLIYVILLCCGVYVSLTAWLIPILLILTSAIIFSVGIVGLYVGRTFKEVQNRPHFVVSEQINFDEE